MIKIQTSLKLCASFVLILLCAQLNGQLFHEQLVLQNNLSFEDIVLATENHYDTKGRGKGQGYKQFQRWKYWAERNLDANGKVRQDIDALSSYNKFASKNNTTSRNITGSYVELGPLATSNTTTWSSALGRISAVGLDPSNDMHIIAGAPTGGIWKTLDYGASWTPLFDDQLLMDVYSLEISHTDPNRYWAGLSQGIVTSTNGGTTWTTVVGATIGLFNTIEMHPSNTNHVFAVDQGNGIVYRSINGGDNFGPVMDHNSFMYDLEFHPTDPDIIYSSGNDAMFKSTDGGANFTEITTGPWSGLGNTLMMAVTPAAPERVYVLEETGGGFNAVYMTEDAGTSWTTLSDNTCDCNNIMGYNQNATGGQGPRDMDIIVSPVDPTIIHVAGVETWRSTDTGANWTKTTAWNAPNGTNFVHADIDLLIYDDARIIAGTDGGIYYSTDEATSWTDITDGIGVRQFYRIGASKTIEDRVSGGSQDNGTGVLKAGTWFDYLGADGMETFIDWSDGDILYGTVQFGSLYKSTNGGVSLGSINTPAGSGNWVTPFEQDPIESNTIYTARNELWKSTNGGQNWTALTDIANGDKADEFKVAPSDNNYMYLTYNSVMHISTDAGATWTTSNLTGSSVNYISVHPDDPERLAIAISGSATKIMESTDAGSTWTNITGNIPANVGIECVLYEELGTGLYAGGNPGVYYTESTGAVNWLDNSNNLPKVRVVELEIRELTMYVATYGRGLWKGSFACDASIIGQACNDLDVCTTNDVYDSNCDCVGTLTDADGDGVCDAEDVCPGGDDTIDGDNDGIPDFCDGCATDCPDSDCDGVCDADDICDGGDDALDLDGDGIPDFCDTCDEQIGTSCDDGNACTTNDIYDAECNCAGTLADADGDGVCDTDDICPGSDDTVDADGDGTPDGCDFCPNPGDVPSLYLEFKKDNYPAETSWEIQNTLDAVITSSFANYATVPGDTIFEEICVDPDCYDFIMKDSYGDGICCGYGQGQYIVRNIDGDTLAIGGQFAFADTTEVCIEATAITDLTISSLMLPSTANGETELYFVVNVFEVGAQSSNGTVTVLLSKDARLPVSWDPVATQVGISNVDNASWEYDASNDGFHIWTNNNSLPSSGASSFGFTGFFDPQNTTGTVSYSATILATSGGEENGLNNIDVETLIYFSN